jgi:hypothetical protein
VLNEAAALLAKGTDISFHLKLSGIIALVAGIAILVFPRLLNYIVAGYLIYVGLVILFNLHI